jgi:hypothetical protein
VKTLQKAAENPESENMRVGLKKILASRLFGVLTMLPTPENVLTASGPLG